MTTKRKPPNAGKGRVKRMIAARLLDHVEQQGDCWIFTGTRIKSGYGKIAVTRGKPAFTHRVAYAEFVGPIPAGMNVLHRCDTPACVNPKHLFMGTQKDNWLDARKKGRNYPTPQQTPNYRHWRSQSETK